MSKFKPKYSPETRKKAVDMFIRLLKTDSNIARCGRAVRAKYGVSTPRLRQWALEDGHDLGVTRIGQQQLQAKNSSLLARIDSLVADKQKQADTIQQLRAENQRLTGQVDALTKIAEKAGLL